MTQSIVERVRERLICALPGCVAIFERECNLSDLAAEETELRAKAARYDHLRKGEAWPAVFASHDAPEPLTGDELDAAIDAARGGK